MKFVTFAKEGETTHRLGVMLENSICDIAAASKFEISCDMLALIERSSALAPQIAKLINNPPKDSLIAQNKATLKAPLGNPPTLKDFFAFEDHALAGSKRRGIELPQEWYEIPAYYKGNPREIYGPDDEIPWPYYTEKLDFECEIACVIGKKGKNIPIEKAHEYIFGYMIYNDFSARDIQRREMKLLFGPNKGKDFANAFGPYILTADEANPSEDFWMRVQVNSEIWSQGHFKNQRWGFPAMLSYVSQEETIYPGDILGSGTYYTGCGLDLNRWIKPGDIVELAVGKLGVLRNKIAPMPAKKELNYKQYTQNKKEGVP